MLRFLISISLLSLLLSCNDKVSEPVTTDPGHDFIILKRAYRVVVPKESTEERLNLDDPQFSSEDFQKMIKGDYSPSFEVTISAPPPIPPYEDQHDDAVWGPPIDRWNGPHRISKEAGVVIGANEVLEVRSKRTNEGQPAVLVRFDEATAQEVFTFTSRCQDRLVAIYWGDRILSIPVIRGAMREEMLLCLETADIPRFLDKRLPATAD